MLQIFYPVNVGVLS